VARRTGWEATADVVVEPGAGEAALADRVAEREPVVALLGVEDASWSLSNVNETALVVDGQPIVTAR